MKKIRLLFIAFLPLFSFRFFEAHFIDKSLLNTACYAYVAIAVLLSIRYFFSNRKLFVLPVQLIVFSILFSVVMAYLLWGQSFKDSLIETVPYLLWIFFFFLLQTGISMKSVEKIIIVYAVLYVILYFFQLANSPTVFFGTSLYGSEFTVDRGITRIIFPGAGFFVLGAFLALNRVTEQKKKNKLFWILLALLGIAIPVLQVTRVFIAAMVLIYVYHFIQRESVIKKVAILASLVLVIFFVANLNNKIVTGLKSASAADQKRGKDYIRVQSSTYFLTDLSPNILGNIFGNGAPYLSFSDYGKFAEQLNKKGYFFEDDGVIGMYAMFGILSVIAYIMIWYKSFKLKLPPEYNYIKYYLWFLLVTCLTTSNIYFPHYLIATVFALYIYQTVYEKHLLSQSPVSAQNDDLTRSLY